VPVTYTRPGCVTIYDTTVHRLVQLTGRYNWKESALTMLCSQSLTEEHSLGTIALNIVEGNEHSKRRSHSTAEKMFCCEAGLETQQADAGNEVEVMMTSSSSGAYCAAENDIHHWSGAALVHKWGDDINCC
jgi:hypothetical protein